MKTFAPILLLTGVAILLLLGIIHLFTLRFAHGDSYPPYSSLRADPLGAMALYDSLGKIPGVAVRRDFSDTDQLPAEPGTVYLHLAGEADEWEDLSPDLFHDLQSFLARGNRLIIAFRPQTHAFVPDEFSTPDTNTTTTGSQPGHARHKKQPGNRPQDRSDLYEDRDTDVSLEEKWGFHPSFQALGDDNDVYTSARVINQTGLPLPTALDWHGGIVFTNTDPAWQEIYRRGRQPVLLERHFGKGSVVLASDSYFVSNEALSTDRHADLLAWLVGSATNVVFDEAHFGIVETTGVATLMRQYRLHGLAAGLLLLAALFIWKNATSLAPPQTDEAGQVFLPGKDSTAGFVNLLRRGISPDDVLAVGFAEWKKTRAAAGRISRIAARAEAVFQQDQSLPPKDRNPRQTYHTIATILGDKKT